MILRKQSLRMSFPMFWLDMWVKMLFREPSTPPNTATTIMTAPMVRIT